MLASEDVCCVMMYVMECMLNRGQRKLFIWVFQVWRVSYVLKSTGMQEVQLDLTKIRRPMSAMCSSFEDLQ